MKKTSDLDEAKAHVERLGFALTPHGADFAHASLTDGCAPIEVAYVVSVQSIALDMKENREGVLREDGDRRQQLARISLHANAIVGMLDRDHEAGSLAEDFYRHVGGFVLLAATPGPDGVEFGRALMNLAAAGDDRTVRSLFRLGDLQKYDPATFERTLGALRLAEG